MTVQKHKDVEFTPGDMMLSSMVFGWTLGFSFFVCLSCVQETRRTKRISTYIVLIWGELIVSILVAIQWVLGINKVIPRCFAQFFMTIFLWSIQVQFLLQIIINRLGVILPTRRQWFWLKYGVAAFILCINISVFCIWIPAQMDISAKFILINRWWDLVEKILFLIVDAFLNLYFIYSVKKRLLDINSVSKYQQLVTFNSRIIVVSMSMDVLLIALLFHRNPYIYAQFHPVAYIVKLNIEIAMAKLIVKIARASGVHVYDDSSAYVYDDSGIQFNHGASSGSIRPSIQRNITSSLQFNVETQTPHNDGHILELKKAAECSSKNKANIGFSEDCTASRDTLDPKQKANLSEPELAHCAPRQMSTSFKRKSEPICILPRNSYV